MADFAPLTPPYELLMVMTWGTPAMRKLTARPGGS